jgi:hypothetical protein
MDNRDAKAMHQCFGDCPFSLFRRVAVMAPTAYQSYEVFYRVRTITVAALVWAAQSQEEVHSQPSVQYANPYGVDGHCCGSPLFPPALGHVGSIREVLQGKEAVQQELSADRALDAWTAYRLVPMGTILCFIRDQAIDSGVT